MRAVLVAMVLALAAAAQQAPSPPLAASVNNTENAQKARTLLNQAIQALGGTAYLNVQDVQEAGRSYSFNHGEPQDVGILFWLFWKFPDEQRVELTKQRDVIYIWNNGRGYEKTFRGTRPMEAKQQQDYERQMEFSLTNVLRRWPNQPDVALFYDGTAIAGDTTTDQVTLMNSTNQSVSVYLDARTHLPLKKTFKSRDPQTGDRDTYEEQYGNYHLIQGVQTPYDVTRLKNGETVSQRFLNRASYNSGLADSLFNATVTYDPDAKKH